MLTYQIAFKLQFQESFTHQLGQIQIADSNSFVLQNGNQVQLQPYLDESTPPLLTFSVSNQGMLFNIASGSASQGVQALAWATFTDSGSTPTLTLDLQVPAGLIAVYYAVIGTSSSGVLMPGYNTIAAEQ